MDKAIVRRLQEAGVYMHKGGLHHDPIAHMLARMPLCAIWHETEEPTREEMELLCALPARLVEAQYWNPAEVKKFCAEGANMITLRKADGQWTYRRMTWSEGPLWFPTPNTLQKIIDEELCHTRLITA